MTPTKLLIGQILVVLAITVASIWTATQWAAAKLAYQPELGPPWFIVFDKPIYHPWSIFPWWFSFDAYAPIIFDEAGAIAAAGGLIGCGAAIFGSLWRARQSNNLTTYGSARWANHRDIKAAKLFNSEGVALGRIGADDLRHDGPEHVMAFAPTRSGKGVGLVIPTLLSWTGSTVVHDIKGENWQLTPGEVMQLAPTDELVLISGHPPIRAKKLRYYEDRRFTARVLPAPALDASGYRDLPAARPDDWAGQVRGADMRLVAGGDTDEGADTDGLEQARHPAHEIEPTIAVEPEIVDPLGLGEDDGDQAAERRAMDRVQALGSARTVYGLDAASGQPDDLQLGL